MLKYVSFIFAAAWVMCSPPLIQIWAIPSHPVLPYLALQTSIRPTVGRQLRGCVPPPTFARSSTDDRLQSVMASSRLASQADDTLSPTFNVNGLPCRAQ